MKVDRENQSQLRAAWIAYWQSWRVYCLEQPGGIGYPAQPAGFQDLHCGATTRAGNPCKRRDLYLSGRCRLHGGLSTGPKTTEGKVVSSANGAKGGRPRKT
jgi:hypothetical protein